MDVTTVISKYNLLTIGISNLTYLYCCCFWRMSLVEVDHHLRFVVSLGWKLRYATGFF